MITEDILVRGLARLGGLAPTAIHIDPLRGWWGRHSWLPAGGGPARAERNPPAEALWRAGVGATKKCIRPWRILRIAHGAINRASSRPAHSSTPNAKCNCAVATSIIASAADRSPRAR